MNSTTDFVEVLTNDDIVETEFKTLTNFEIWQNSSSNCQFGMTSTAIAIAVVLALFGLLIDGTVLAVFIAKLRSKVPKIRKSASTLDVYMIALISQDFLYNIGGVLVGLYYDGKHYLGRKAMTQLEEDLNVVVCCVFNATSTAFLIIIAVDRYIAVFYPFYKGQTVSRAKKQIGVSFVLLLCYGVTAVFIPRFVFITLILPVVNFTLYFIIFLKMKLGHSRRPPTASVHSSQRSGGLAVKTERSLAMTMVYTSLISLLSVIPCLWEAFFYISHTEFSRQVMDMQYTSCWIFFASMLHHPVTGLNYFVHPIMFYTTSTKFREDVKQFLFSSSKPPQMRADVEMQSNRTGDVVQQNREFKNPITEAKTN